MLDLSHIPSQQQLTTTFYVTSGSTWQTWNKPRNAKMIEIFCLGGGAGGGQSSITAGSTGGGGGGASGGIVRGIIPAFLLPDTIYIQVAKGGAGVTTNAVGGTGGISYIGLQPSTSEQTLICKSSTAVAGGGGQVGGAGAPGAVSVVSLSAFGNLGLFTAITGVNGTAAGTSAGTAGTNQAALGTNIVTGGCGGGGKTSVGAQGNGGSITSALAILTTQVNGGQAAGDAGSSGYGTLQPFCGTGGAGGAGRGGTVGAGGNGGDGWYGCGGGGAGAGSAAAKAGDGGDGLVIITVIT